MPKNRNTATGTPTDLDAFKAQVLEVALEAKAREGWCEAGFSEAMSRLGIQVPTYFEIPVRIHESVAEHEEVEDRSNRSSRPFVRTTKYLPVERDLLPTTVRVMATSEAEALEKVQGWSAEEFANSTGYLSSEGQTYTHTVPVSIKSLMELKPEDQSLIVPEENLCTPTRMQRSRGEVITCAVCAAPVPDGEGTTWIWPEPVNAEPISASV